MGRRQLSTTVYLDADQLRDLKILSEVTRVAQSAYIREGVGMVLERYRDKLPTPSLVDNPEAKHAAAIEIPSVIRLSAPCLTPGCTERSEGEQDYCKKCRTLGVPFTVTGADPIPPVDHQARGLDTRFAARTPCPDCRGHLRPTRDSSVHCLTCNDKGYVDPREYGPGAVTERP